MDNKIHQKTFFLSKFYFSQNTSNLWGNFFDKSEGVSKCETFPLSTTKILSESSIVCNLCAIVKTVEFLNSFLIVFCISWSVFKSTADVASSKKKKKNVRSGGGMKKGIYP